MKVDDELRRHFRCPKCDHRGAETRRFAATGTGLSRFLDIQHNKYICVSCTNCGYTELYDPRILEGRGSAVTDVLDAIFGS